METRDYHADPNKKDPSAMDNVKHYLDDSKITALVKGQLLTQKGIDSLEIKVVTENGIVTLSGEVDEKSQISLAESVARKVDGVVSVVNRLVYENVA